MASLKPNLYVLCHLKKPFNLFVTEGPASCATPPASASSGTDSTYKTKEVDKSFNSKCITWTIEKTWTLNIKIWVICQCQCNSNNKFKVQVVRLVFFYKFRLNILIWEISPCLFSKRVSGEKKTLLLSKPSSFSSSFIIHKWKILIFLKVDWYYTRAKISKAYPLFTNYLSNIIKSFFLIMLIFRGSTYSCYFVENVLYSRNS